MIDDLIDQCLHVEQHNFLFLNVFKYKDFYFKTFSVKMTGF